MCEHRRVKVIILDVGSGCNPVGDINCDLFTGYTPHYGRPVEKTEYFIKCDAQYLPFRDDTFSIVHSSHLLEHTHNPYAVLLEMKRVSKKYVYARLPNTNYHVSQRPEHIYGWDHITLKNLLLQFFPEVSVYCSPRPFIHGRILDRLWLVQQVLNVVFRRLLRHELIAICKMGSS